MPRFLRTDTMLVGLMLLGASSGAVAGPESRPVRAAAATPSAAVEARIRERVSAYWKARMTLDLAACFPFYEASFRAQHTPASFARDFRRLNRFAPEFRAVKAVKLDPTGTRAIVRVRLRTKPDVLGGQVLDSDVEEIWVLQSGEWWRAAESLMPQV